MAGFNSVWSLDIGKASLKAVHLRKSGSQVQVLKSERIEYDVGEEGIDSIGGQKDALQVFCSRNSIHDPVFVALQGREALPRFIKIMADSDKKLQELVQFEARQQIPFDIDDVVWDWQQIPSPPDSGPEKEVGIFAARREAVDDVLIDLQSNNIKAYGIVPGYLGLLNFAMHELHPKVPSIVLDIGATHTSLVLIHAGFFWIRELTFSGNKVTQELVSRFGLTFNEAERLKKQAPKSEQAQKIYTALQNVLGSFVTEIRQSITHYQRLQESQVQFKNVYLLGNGSYTLGLTKFLKDRLKWNVQRINKFSRFRAGEGVDIATMRQNLPALSTSFGVGLQGLGMSHADINLMPHEQKMHLAFVRKRKMVFVTGAVLLLILFLFSQNYNKMIGSVDDKIKTATKTLDDLRDIQDQIPEQSEIDALTMKVEALQKIGRGRKFLGYALTKVNDLLAKVSQDAFNAVQAPAGLAMPLKGSGDQKGETIIVTPEGKQDEVLEAAESFVKSVHGNSVSVLSLDVLSSAAKPDKNIRTRPTSKQGSEKGYQPLQYTYQLTGAIMAGKTGGSPDPTQSLNEVKRRVLQPLSQALKEDPFIKAYLVQEPVALELDQPMINDMAPVEMDRFFSTKWYLVGKRALEDANAKLEDEKKERDTIDEDETLLLQQQEPQYYMFTIEWIIGEQKPEPENKDAFDAEA